MFDSYQATLEFLFNSLPVYQKIGGKAMKMDLSNIEQLSAALGNPHRSFPSIHIAGTNGKGSVSHMLAAAFIASGYRTGLYTSPHYRDFRERVRIDGIMIGKDAVVDFVNANYVLFLDLQPSFFEMTVALALRSFADAGVDIAIIETGLGGRLDSTNIVTPELSIITNVSLDHQAYLGTTIPEIAQEKAGIIKPNVPCVLGRADREVASVVKSKCRQTASNFYKADEIASVSLIEHTERGLKCAVQSELGLNFRTSIDLPLHGLYQLENLQTTIAALEVFNHGVYSHPNQLLLQVEKIVDGIEHLGTLTGMQGRFQMLRQDPMVIVDGGHNPAGLEAILESLGEFAYQRIHIVVGFSKGKDIDSMIASMPESATYLLCAADIVRAVPVEEVANHFVNHSSISAYPSVAIACDTALRQTDPQDLILITGSIFVVAEALLHLDA